MKKIGICTIYTGFNYGSSLQAFATKILLKEMGFQPEIVRLTGSLFKGRDVRLGKLMKMFFRSIIHPFAGSKAAQTYKKSYTLELSEKTKSLFLSFYQNDIVPNVVSYRNLTKVARTDEYTSFVCGSDQVWNATALYVDPFYYLRFAPIQKRISFAPSFGKDQVPKYNKAIIGKYLKGFSEISVREESGLRIVEELCHRRATQLIDPTLVVNADIWRSFLSIKHEFSTKKYILAYFLAQPSNEAIQKINFLRENYSLEVYYLPYAQNDFGWKCFDAGPIEFLSLLDSASFVVTDSFHGLAFSVNFNKEFYVFSRNYGSAANQSTRITSLLEKIGLLDRLDNIDSSVELIDFNYTNAVLKLERKKSLDYLKSALLKLEGVVNE